MPIDGAGTYSLPAGYLAVTGTAINVTEHNPIFEDVQAALTACVKRNGAGAMTGLLTLSGDPSTSLQAATKQYTDAAALAAVGALDIKPSVLIATTANITLSGEQTIEGVLTAASRVLVKNQTAPAENGIYLTGAGAWARVTDMAAWSAVPGSVVTVETGTQWADTVWLNTSNAGGTIGSTTMTWRRIDGQPLRNAQTGTTYTVLADDHARHTTYNNASAVAVTLPQATGNFNNGFCGIHENLGAGLVTITPTTSTINGAATLTLSTGERYLIDSDGTNYRAASFGLGYANVAALTEDTAPDPADFVVTAKATGTKTAKTKISNIGLALPGAVGLLITNSGTTSISLSADNVIALNGALGAAGTALSVTIDCTTTGANALDTGGLANTSEYHVFAIYNGTTQTWAGLASLSATAPTMPSGYTFKVRLGCMITGGAATFLRTRQVGRDVTYTVLAASTTAALPTLSLSTSQTRTSLTVRGTTGSGNALKVPSTATKIKLVLSGGSTTNSRAFIAPNTDAGWNSTTAALGTQAGPLGFDLNLSGSVSNNSAEIALESAAIGYTTGSGWNGVLQVYGWTDKVNAS